MVKFSKLEKARFDPVYQDWEEIGRLSAPRFGHRIIFGRLRTIKAFIWFQNFKILPETTSFKTTNSKTSCSKPQKDDGKIMVIGGKGSQSIENCRLV